MNFIKFHSEKNFIISGVCLSGVCHGTFSMVWWFFIKYFLFCLYFTFSCSKIFIEMNSIGLPIEILLPKIAQNDCFNLRHFIAQNGAIVANKKATKYTRNCAEFYKLNCFFTFLNYLFRRFLNYSSFLWFSY